MTATSEPIFAKYSPSAVLTVPAGYHATCTAPVCIARRRLMMPGSEYVQLDRTTANRRGRAEHLECNVAAHEALFKQEHIDSTTPPTAQGGTPTITG